MNSTDATEVPRGKPPRRGPYAKTSRRRAQIIDAAFRAFGTSGFLNSSTREIAETAGVSEAGLRHHFPTKIALLEAVLRERDVISTYEFEHDRDAISGRERLEGYVRQIAKNVHRRGEVELYTVLSAESTAPDHPAREYFHDRFAWTTELMRASLDDVRADGGLRDGVDTAGTARALIGLADGLQVQWLMDDSFAMAPIVEAAVNSVLIDPISALGAVENDEGGTDLAASPDRGEPRSPQSGGKRA